jgi:two-component system, NarL family, sensor histidine kinase UhpB
MSLRIRLIASIVIVLLISLCVGGAAAGWHAVRSVRTEMLAALAVGAQTLHNGIDGSMLAYDPQTELEGLVRTFDGDRHLRAILSDAAGQPVLTSRPPPVVPRVPARFVTLLSPSLPPLQVAIPQRGAITLQPDPRNEVGEVWTQLQDDLVAVSLSCGLSIILVSLVVGRALRPLDRLSAALASLGSGEYAVRVPTAGPPELVRLAQGFNAMVERLDAAQARTLRLDEQLLKLQEEERTDLARDLHDEVGPFLFAVHLDAASIEQAAASGRIAEVTERTHAIRESVGHMQRHVRAMLHRLRPANPVDAGLSPALGSLVAFWRARQPAIDFTLDIAVDEDAIAEPAMAAIYRLVQEGLNNAVRHGRPRRVAVAIGRAQPDQTALQDGIVVRIADDGVGLSPSGAPGLGFKGMRERVQACNGHLHVGPAVDGKGLVVTAMLPYAPAMEAA